MTSAHWLVLYLDTDSVIAYIDNNFQLYFDLQKKLGETLKIFKDLKIFDVLRQKFDLKFKHSSNATQFFAFLLSFSKQNLHCIPTTFNNTIQPCFFLKKYTILIDKNLNALIFF